MNTAVFFAILVGFALISCALATVDVRTHRLPNRIVLPSYPVLVSLLLLSCATGTPWNALFRALICGALLFGFYAILRALPGAGMGGGDVKLAGIIGLLLGFIGWVPFVVGGAAAFVLGGLFTVMMLALRRVTRESRIPFGPFMLGGAWCGIAVGVGSFLHGLRVV
ncbi:leader peptidase (prepilin peptidase)/N-methyltransferase [Microbacterium endophyticum]|uniref:Leader peptidase (Prepilin peptidase)/N-methyltransferase n=1 Tax=Microbacterium endophyticum TaxID=1526412 RepID=A0A7W4V4L0_9MICO|nr:prepilin peptidase [Microbacterium endophyticum]MBB2976190.1 leader peptidase (prepilin peptidase)/N-methyltransferase [Microbacterium endophyticum]NIK36487.1 leader peptidase (prepilin peptidase)/N-methyltransferase [Microbacterium endophyticum]